MSIPIIPLTAKGVRPTRRNRRVLTALLTGATNLGGGTIYTLTGGGYPALAALERAGWVTGEWVDTPDGPSPPRRFYRLTPDGRTQAIALLKLEM